MLTDSLEEIVVPTTGDGGGDEALQLTSDGAGDKRPATADDRWQ